MLNKKRVLLMILVLTAAIIAVGCGGDKPVAQVNGVDISSKELERRVNNYTKNLEKQGLGEFLAGEEGKQIIEKMRSDMLEDMIMHQVLLSEAENLGIVPATSTIETEIEMIKNQMSTDQFKQMLNDYNWSEKDLENYFFEQMVEQAVYDEATKEVAVNEEEIKNFYEEHKDELVEVRSSHILVETEEEALEILAQLKSGADFAELAKEKSNCPSKEMGGDLNFAPKGMMVSEFDEAVFQLPVGKMTDQPVKTEFGYHIIKVTDKRESLDELRVNIEGILAAEEKAAIFNNYLEELMEKATIVRN